jgi:hypothetical protein
MAIQLFSTGHSGAFMDRTILEQRHTEIPEEERHILSLSVHYLSVDNFWGLRLDDSGQDDSDDSGQMIRMIRDRQVGHHLPVIR